MRLFVIATVGAILVAGMVRADDASVEVIKKAIKAHGGSDNLKKALSVKGTASGTMYRDGAAVTGEIEYVSRLPNYEQVTTQISGNPIKLVGTVTKDQYTVKYGTQVIELSANDQADKKTSLQIAYVCTLVPLLSDKAYTMSIVDDQDAGGGKITAIRIQRNKEVDVILCFDTTSGLLVRAVYQGFVGEKRVKKEIVYGDYKAIDGVMRPMTGQVHCDGKLLMKYTVREEKIGEDSKVNDVVKP